MRRLFTLLSSMGILAVLAFIGGSFFLGTRTMHDLLANSEELRQAISTLTHEDQIGYAKVVKQEERDGQLYTTIRFVETARGEMLNKVLEKEYEIAGNIVYFDALVVTFSDQAVMDGQSRSLYLWRRIYGEQQSPADGFDIQTPGSHPERYADLLSELKLADQNLFWEAIWGLASDPEALREYGIKAVFGNAVYTRFEPGVIYIFRIGTDGQIYPETVPDL